MDNTFSKTMLFQHLVDWECLLADGFDDAIIGISSCSSPKAVYSVNKVIEILMKEGMSQEDAIEHFDYNIAGSYVGDKTPIFVNAPDE
jgi:hypothetical protein|tara:strand:- start:2 stop:265 length:264 start_codon:yes stop_codon:yes gene_type:complete